MDTLLDTLHSHFGKENVVPIEKHQGVFLCEKKTGDNKTYQNFKHYLHSPKN